MFATYVVTDLIAKVLRSRSSFSPLPSPTMGLPTSRTAPRESRFGACKRPIIHLYAQWKTAETIVLTHLERMFARTDDNRLLWLQGIGWAVAGGSLAGLCLVFTKAVVKTYFLPGHPVSCRERLEADIPDGAPLTTAYTPSDHCDGRSANHLSQQGAPMR